MRNRKQTILFDMGNTLVEYYGPNDWPTVVEETVGSAGSFLRAKGLANLSEQIIRQRVELERHDRQDFRVVPLHERLGRIFGLDDNLLKTVKDGMCAAFLAPIFARGKVYADTFGCLEELKSKGFKTAIVSNTPWGSSGDLWRAELDRLGILERIDDAIFCTDVGWRKPARQIFEYTLSRLNAKVEQCVFVGDDPRWDIEGPRAMGMEALLIDRTGTINHPEEPIRNLEQLVKYLTTERS